MKYAYKPHTGSVWIPCCEKVALHYLNNGLADVTYLDTIVHLKMVPSC